MQWNTIPGAGCIKCAGVGNKCGVNVSCLLRLKVFFFDSVLVMSLCASFCDLFVCYYLKFNSGGGSAGL